MLWRRLKPMSDVHFELPDVEDAASAERALRVLDGSDDVLVRAGGASAPLPPEARDLLRQLLGHLANGDAVTVVPMHAELTAQQAAELLGVSRPFLIRLVDEGKLAYRMVGTHRRVSLADVLAFKKANKAARRILAAELTAEAEELGLYK
jgi:excisionase family DNA binding protein